MIDFFLSACDNEQKDKGGKSSTYAKAMGLQFAGMGIHTGNKFMVASVLRSKKERVRLPRSLSAGEGKYDHHRWDKWEVVTEPAPFFTDHAFMASYCRKYNKKKSK